MQISSQRLIGILFGILWSFLGFLLSPTAFAGSDQPIHHFGDKEVWNRKTNQVELFGHAAVIEELATLTSDYIHLDLNSRTMDAFGNCTYVAPDAIIYGEEMHFNIDTHTGTIFKGRVASNKFLLRGTKIHKLGDGKFQAYDANYTTCRDCAPIWALEARDADMEVEGYAYLSDVIPRVKGAPAAWMPYLIMPMKTQRQSGFLFPNFSFSGPMGAVFVLPYFWALGRSADLTVGVGEYTERGQRLEFEGRYVYDKKSTGLMKFAYFRDRASDLNSSIIVKNRWALEMVQSQELPFGITEMMKFSDVSDNFYPYVFGDVTEVTNEAFLKSRLTFMKSGPGFSSYLHFQRNRNLLHTAEGDPGRRQTDFDPRTVQVLPSFGLNLTDQLLGSSGLTFSLGSNFTHFTRSAGDFDYDSSSGVPFGAPVPNPAPVFRPGIDPIRKASRFSLVPSLFTTFRIADVVSVIPSLQYRSYFYNFGDLASPLSRGYLLFQTDLSAQLERVYEFKEDKLYPRARHMIRPLLTYSLIPLQNESSHPFTDQMKNAGERGITGYQFDNYDTVPYSTSKTGGNYLTPLGHSLSYGFVTQWVRRVGAVDSLTPSYETNVELSGGHGINLVELGKSDSTSALSRLFGTLNFSYAQLKSLTTYQYFPDVTAPSRHKISTSLSYVLERAAHQRIYAFDRSLTLNYVFNKIDTFANGLNLSMNFSISDYLLPFAGIGYSFEPSQLTSANAGLKIQSPSQCWMFTLYSSFAPPPNPGVTFSFDFAMNLTGSGFAGIDEVVGKVTAH